MKKFTQDDYILIQRLLKEEVQQLTRYSYMRYTNMEELNKDMNIVKALIEKVSERIK